MAEIGPVIRSVATVVKSCQGIYTSRLKAVLRQDDLLKQMHDCGVKETLLIKAIKGPLGDFDNKTKILGLKQGEATFDDIGVVFFRERTTTEKFRDINIPAVFFGRLIEGFETKIGPVVESVSIIVRAHERIHISDIEDILSQKGMVRQMSLCGVKDVLAIRGTNSPVTDLENAAKLLMVKLEAVKFGDVSIVFFREEDYTSENVHDIATCAAQFEKYIDEHKEEKEKRKQAKLTVQ